MRTLYYKTVERLTSVQVLQHYTGFGLYDRQVMDVVRRYGDPYPYFRGMVAEVGFPIKQIQYGQKRRTRGITKNNFYTLYDMAMLGITNLSKVPLRMVTFGGFVFAAISLVLGFIYLVAKLIFWNHFELGLAPTMIGLFFLGSVTVDCDRHHRGIRGVHPHHCAEQAAGDREGTDQLLNGADRPHS